MRYLLALIFIFFGKNEHLIICWKKEVIRKDYFSLVRLLREKRPRERNYLFWWRLASEMYLNGNKLQRKAARKINIQLLNKFGCDIGMGAKVGKGLTIYHHVGIVVTSMSVIGENFTIRQQTTIGRKQDDKESDICVIGDNVDIGAHTLILGAPITIGDNVKIGAMSYIQNDIPSNCTYITEKESRVIAK